MCRKRDEELCFLSDNFTEVAGLFRTLKAGLHLHAPLHEIIPYNNVLGVSWTAKAIRELRITEVSFKANIAISEIFVLLIMLISNLQGMDSKLMERD